MYSFLTKHGQTAALGLGVLCIAIFLITTLSGISSAGYDMSTDLNALPDEAKDGIGFFNPGIGLTVFLVVACFVLALAFGLLNFVKFPKASMKAAIGLVAILVIFGILYATSSMESAGKLGMLHDKFSVSEGTSKFISGGIKTTVGLSIVAFFVMIGFEIRNLFK